MQYTQLGRTGLTVSRLCLGTMHFGPETSDWLPAPSSSRSSRPARATGWG